jgi:hypothetical protein
LTSSGVTYSRPANAARALPARIIPMAPRTLDPYCDSGALRVARLTSTT